ncbi:hypothetical protein ID0444_11540 [Helicobacter pylori]
MQVLFDKINNGSPFLNNKCHFIGFVEIVIGPIESLFFVYENEPSTTFNLKNFLLVLAKYIYSKKICYCENKQDKNTHNLIKIIILSTIGKALRKILKLMKLPSAIIDKIEYHFRDNTFHFIFDVSNKFLSGKSRLTIEVPRVKLENIKLPDMKEIYVNQWYINIFINALIFSINEGSYTLTGV